RFGRLARRRVEDARDRVAALVGAKPENVIFTSGGSEANALAMALGSPRPPMVGATEHDSILRAVPDAKRIPVHADGRIDQDRLQRLLDAAGGPAFVSVQLANNETGVIQPIAELAGQVHAAGGLIHVDAAQAPGRIVVDASAL